jgi:abortive infection bacteriophage resistance protein
MYTSRTWLYQKYVVEKKTIVEIAKEANCNHQTIQNYLQKFNLIRNSRSWK